MRFFKRKKKTEINTPIIFKGIESDMFIEKCSGQAKIIIALCDYLGDDFIELLIEKYHYEFSDEFINSWNKSKKKQQPG